ncbi:MAG: nicotinate-nucleotide adenylyltransferase [Candidatus Aureabacteria bacterium]|nr:nicotinate-nucleotide adenylyltransferase [Candidatus Auribacterota bacterium]
MERIGLFGGTFNPVHIGHIACAKSLVEKNIVDRIIFIPSKIPPLKKIENTILAETRLQMVEAAISQYPNFSISDVELKREGVSYTIDTVRSFIEYFDSDKVKLYLIIGIDWVQKFHSWKDYEKLSDLIDFIVMRRNGSLGNINNPYLDVNIRRKLEKGLVDVPAIPVSSTEIKKRIDDVDFVKKSLPEEVYQFIIERRLYL